MIEQIDKDLKSALLARDSKRVTVLRGLKASLLNERINKGADLDEAEAIKVLKREVKKRQEAADMYSKADRSEQAAAEEYEEGIINEYLPTQLSDDELMREAEATIEELNAHNMQDMGRVMGALSTKLEGRADNAKLSQMVKDMLARG